MEEGVRHYGRKVWREGDSAVIACRSCGFNHLHPLPEETYVLDVYEQYPDYIERHSEDNAWWQIDYDERYDFFEQARGADAERSILDIGSGPGHFLARGVQRGWLAAGVEPSEKAWRFSREQLGLNVHHCLFGKENYRDFGRFSAINLNNVLEHMVTPLENLRLMREILLEKGILCVAVPNDFSTLQKLIVTHLEKPAWWVAPKEHINYFTPASLKRLLSAAGFRVLNLTFSFPMELFLAMGMDYVGNDAVGREVHLRRREMELFLRRAGADHLRRKLYRCFGKLGIGRTMTAYAEKG